MVTSSVARRSLQVLLAAAILCPGLASAQSISVGGHQVAGCKGTLENFRLTGMIECGHFLWDIHPEDASRIEAPAEYLAVYERYYAFMKELTGVAPSGTIALRERCMEAVEGQDCPKGSVEPRARVYAQGNDVFFSPEIGGSLAFASSHDRRPPVLQVARAIGGLFVPSMTAARAYRWDAPMQDAWSDNLAVFAYLMEVEQLTAVPFYYDYFCKQETGNAPCDTLMDSVDAMAAIGADGSLAHYEAAKGGFKWLVPLPLQREPNARSAAMTGMFAALYREAKADGGAKKFLEGVGALMRFYEKGFPYPASWRHDDAAGLTRAQLDKRADVFVFLLGASVQRSIGKRFLDWGWPVSALTRVSLPVLQGQKWDEALKLKILKSLLGEKSTVQKQAGPAVPMSAAVPTASAPARTSVAASTTRNVPAGSVSQPGTPNIEQVQSTQRSVENGASIPAPGSGDAAPTAQAGGLLGNILDAIRKAISAAQPQTAPAAAPSEDGGGGASTGNGGDGSDPDFSGIKDIEKLGDTVFTCDANGKCTQKTVLPTYKKLEGPLFVKGALDYADIHPDDVKQGALGDCYYLASLAAVALNDSKTIRDLFKDNGGGKYTVYLYSKADKGWWEFWKPEFTRAGYDVDNEFPMNSRGTIFAREGAGEEAKELWVLLAEKAYAMKHAGSYAEIGRGGWPGDALEELTGKRSDRRAAADVLLRQLQAWYNKKAAVSPFTPVENDAMRAKHLVGTHAYYLEKADAREGYAAIANPWGWGEEHINLTEKEFRGILAGVHENPIH